MPSCVMVSRILASRPSTFGVHVHWFLKSRGHRPLVGNNTAMNLPHQSTLEQAKKLSEGLRWCLETEDETCQGSCAQL